MLIPAFDDAIEFGRRSDLQACMVLGEVAWTGTDPPLARPGDRIRWRPGVRTRAALEQALEVGTGRVIVESEIGTDDLLGLPIDRIVVRIGPDFAEAVETIVRCRPFVGGFQLASSSDGSSMPPDACRSLRRLSGDRRFAVEDGGADPGRIAVLDAMGVDVLRAAGFTDGALDPVDALAAVFRSPRIDGTWPTVVCNGSGLAMALLASSARSVRRMMLVRRAVFETTDGLHAPGSADAASPRVESIEIDLSRTALRVVLRPAADRSDSRPSPRLTGWVHEASWQDRVPVGDRSGDLLIGPPGQGPSSLVDLIRHRHGRVAVAG